MISSQMAGLEKGFKSSVNLKNLSIYTYYVYYNRFRAGENINFGIDLISIVIRTRTLKLSEIFVLLLLETT